MNRTTLLLALLLAAGASAQREAPGVPPEALVLPVHLELTVYRTWKALPKALRAQVEKDVFKASMVAVEPRASTGYVVVRDLKAGAPLPGADAVYDEHRPGPQCGPCRGVHVERTPRDPTQLLAQPEPVPPTRAYVVPKTKGRVFLRILEPRCPPCTAP